MGLKDQWLEGMDWIYLSWNTDMLLVFVRSVKSGSFLTGWETIDFQEGLSHWCYFFSAVTVPDNWSLSEEPADIHNDIFSTDKNSIPAGIADKSVGVG
jgi:hypothetical protein